MTWMGSTFRAAVVAAVILPVILATDRQAVAAQAPAPSAGRQLGTVKAISGNNLTLAADGGAQVSVTVADGARILQLAPGNTDLKSAQPITLGDVTVGDRVLVTGKSDDDGSFAATRVILMKSGDIAQKNEADKGDWQRRGSGGIVTAVDGSTIAISAAGKKIAVQTGATTKFRRYAADSVKFEDTKSGTLADVKTGDQLRVRGDKSEDGLTITGDEVVSGAFKNLAGTLTAIDAANGTVSFKDLATKKAVTVKVTSNSDLRKLPPEMAARLAARAKGGAAGAPGAPAGGGQGAPANAQASGAAPTGGAGSSHGQGGEPGGPGGAGGPGRQGGGDLSQMLVRFPEEKLSDLKNGDAVMVVASDASSNLTAVTMLSGVEPILAASPSGSPAMTLSPWNMGGGGGAEAAGPQ